MTLSPEEKLTDFLCPDPDVAASASAMGNVVVVALHIVSIDRNSSRLFI
jgi:hypothetical protein